MFALDSCHPVIYPYTGFNCTLIFPLLESVTAALWAILFIPQPKIADECNCGVSLPFFSRITCCVLGLEGGSCHLQAACKHNIGLFLVANINFRGKVTSKQAIFQSPAMASHPFSQAPGRWVPEARLGTGLTREGDGGRRVNLRNPPAWRFQGHLENHEGEL